MGSPEPLCARCNERKDGGVHDTVETCEAVRGPCLDPGRHHPFVAAPSPVTGEAELPRTFGELVRRDRGAAQAIDAAKAAGVSRSFWSDVEHNRRAPSRIVASKMCGAVVGNWNEWLIAWARERLDGSFDDLRLAIEAEASAEPPRTIDVADAHGTLTGSGTEADPYRTPGELGRGYTRAEALYDLAARLDSQGSQSPDATATGSAQGREK